ncbi:SDR family oxidoreductase [Geobacillus sp. G4]|jgi:3-oxoacyl-[acyl-carrier protein] reductase|uniref:3-oxoacyl-[acyl-carrier-protein] reductase n=3 Tax=Geobacillus TaxID=129337 RepID=Q5KZY0_GEOKA|nr:MULTISPECIES: SDR family oxidoreductase [Geobacillus]AMV10710.1 3-oxoacyl-ACP reductase [Geobacillus thermoleovorans]AUI35593.1 NAD(P)-dependent oxidoreductase [[Bacillus] caldolyticus]ESU71746.1 3-oxoacyl-ACP reductase [Geobacillus sp. MAS1]TLS34702.1 SDR family oxidoreductase [Geobacillus thermoleovorans]TRY43577.1 SDR family oxidoreductase [Geobacillus sp. LEMMJ02]
MFDMKALKGKNIVITGASRGIGYETAKQLAKLGSNLALGSRTIKQMSPEQFSSYGNVFLAEVDVADERSVKDFVCDVVSTLGSVDALINSAGVGTFANVLDSQTDEFDTMISVNLRGTYLCCKHFGRHMVERRKGRILNMVSVAGVTAIPGCGGYCASKFGVLGLTKVLQSELRAQGVYVSAVIPGAVRSSFWDRIDHQLDVKQMIPVETLAKHIVYMLAQPEDALIDEIVITPPLGIL